MDRWLRAWFLLLWLPGTLLAQQGSVPAQQEAAPATPAKDPVLSQRPQAKADGMEGRIQLDVVVNAKRGGPVAGLQLKDFTVLDSEKRQELLSFREIDGSAAARDGQVEVILLLDLVNSTFEQAGIARAQIVKFLEQNGGHLAYPTSIMVLSEEGMRIQPRPSSDGNALAAVLGQANATVHSAGLGEVGRFQLSVRSLASIAENEVKIPGRKLLIWTGPGWPVLGGPNYGSTAQDRERAFDTIVEIATRMREAHIALYSISPMADPKAGAPGVISPPHGGMMPAGEAPQQSGSASVMSDTAGGASYKAFLRGVKSAKQADTENLALQVIAVQSGGRVLDPSNDLATQMANCQEDLGVFYRLSFNPVAAEHTDEYHELKVKIDRPGLTAHSSLGYYNQP